MARPKNKQDLISEALKSYASLNDYINHMDYDELHTEFDFSSLNKKEAHWSRDKNLRDIYIHLYEWQKLLINWVNNNLNGISCNFLKDGYTWSNYGEMNMEFYRSHQKTSEIEAKELLDYSHNEVMKLMDKFTTDELFNKNVYPWVGGSTLGQYFISTTVAHYEWALNKLKQHHKICNNK